MLSRRDSSLLLRPLKVREFLGIYSMEKQTEKETQPGLELVDHPDEVSSDMKQAENQGAQDGLGILNLPDELQLQIVYALADSRGSHSCLRYAKDRCLSADSKLSLPDGRPRPCMHKDLYHLASTSTHMFDLVVEVMRHRFDDCCDDVEALMQEIMKAARRPSKMQQTHDTSQSRPRRTNATIHREELLTFAFNRSGMGLKCIRQMLRALHAGKPGHQIVTKHPLDSTPARSDASALLCVPCVLGLEAGFLDCEHKRECPGCLKQFGPYARGRDLMHHQFHGGHESQRKRWSRYLLAEAYHESGHKNGLLPEQYNGKCLECDYDQACNLGHLYCKKT